MENSSTHLKSLDEMKEESIKNLQSQIDSQSKLYFSQETEIMMALLQGQESVWVTKESGAKVQFKIPAAIQGLATIRLSIEVRESLILRLKGNKRINYSITPNNNNSIIVGGESDNSSFSKHPNYGGIQEFSNQ